MWGAHLPPLQVETPEGRVLARLDRVLRPEVDKRPAARSPGIRVAAAQRGKSGRARASEMKQTRDAAIFAWAADGADFLDHTGLNRLEKALPVAVLGGMAGVVMEGDSDGGGPLDVRWYSFDGGFRATGWHRATGWQWAPECWLAPEGVLARFVDYAHRSHRSWGSLKVADLDKPIETGEEAWKALCSHYGVEPAQGLDPAAFVEVLSEWPGGVEIISQLHAKTPTWKAEQAELAAAKAAEAATEVFAWAACGTDFVLRAGLNRLRLGRHHHT